MSSIQLGLLGGVSVAAIGIGVLLIKDVFDTRDRRWRREEIARAARRQLRQRSH